MVWCKVLILGIIFVSVGDCRKPRILNGKEATIEYFPYQASLRLYNFHVCGGSIISEKHILTAGHCIFGHLYPPYAGITVNTGTSRRNELGNVHYIDRAIVHPNYFGDAKRAYCDIAIITLKDTIVFNKYQQKINLPRQNPQAGQKVYVTGWGYTWQQPMILPNQLQWIETSIASKYECQRRMIDPINTIIYDVEICTRSNNESGVCTGDSGGSLSANGEIVGIVSWTDGFLCGVNATDVYTNVYQFKNFIQTVMYNFG